MRHRSQTHSFNRRQGPRLALIKGLMNSILEHGRIRTTVPKAKELRRHIEKAVTLGKKGTLHSRRLLISRLGCSESAGVVMDTLAAKYKSRKGGYTRIVKAGARPGDGAEMAFIELVDYEAKKATPAQDKAAGTVKKKARVVSREALRKRKVLRGLQGQARRVART